MTNPAPLPPSQQQWLTPYLSVHDAEAMIDFYNQAFGFALGFAMRDEQGGIQHVEMRHHDVGVVMFCPESLNAEGQCVACPTTTGHAPATTLCVYVTDVDAFAAHATAAGAALVHPPTDQPWGRNVIFRDPAGYRWLFLTPPVGMDG